ncbi:MAG: hypothetical protein ACHREM_22105 [Polyangiales bacterium]
MTAVEALADGAALTADDDALADGCVDALAEAGADAEATGLEGGAC